jgi:uncharacterized protein YecE (DUF72 family)
MARSELRIGISGWTYTPWRGTFYPKDLTQKRELEFASRQFNSIEINGSFYSLQRPTSYQLWRDVTPEDFVFSVKGGRFISHMKKLRDIDAPLANFFASGVLALGKKLGPILWQFPPSFGFDQARFAAFFDLLPRDHASAAKLARKHDARLEGRAYTKADVDQPIRHCVEIRHHTFENEAFVKLLRAHRIGLVVADTASKWPLMEDVTTDFVYVRLHGDEQLYVSGYTDKALDAWAAKVAAWREGTEADDGRRVAARAKKLKSRDVYVYFDNDAKVRAPFDAIALGKRLGVAQSDLKDPERPGEDATAAASRRAHAARKKRLAAPVVLSGPRF